MNKDFLRVKSKKIEEKRGGKSEKNKKYYESSNQR